MLAPNGGVRWPDLPMTELRFAGKAGSWDKSMIRYNDEITLTGIPEAAHEYHLGRLCLYDRALGFPTQVAPAHRRMPFFTLRAFGVGFTGPCQTRAAAVQGSPRRKVQGPCGIVAAACEKWSIGPLNLQTASTSVDTRRWSNP